MEMSLFKNLQDKTGGSVKFLFKDVLNFICIPTWEVGGLL